MFDPEVAYESMNFFEKLLYLISEKFVAWVETTITNEAILGFLGQVDEQTGELTGGLFGWLVSVFGERSVAYGFVDFIDFVADLLIKFGVL